MNVIEPTTPLGEIVTAHPALARNLERLGLDYCCGGGRSLADACAEQGLDAVAVAEALTDDAAGTGAEGWATMGPTELVDHLEATHHAYLHGELPRIEALIAKVEGVHGERHPELAFVQATFDELAFELDPHLAREERILFPMIRQLGDARGADERAALTGPIGVMLVEHDRAGELLERLRSLTDGYRPPDDGCASYRALYEALAQLEADTHLHVHKENNVLFPAVLPARAEARETTR